MAHIANQTQLVAVDHVAPDRPSGLTRPTGGGISRWICIGVFGLCLTLAMTALLPLLPVDVWWIRIGDFPRVQLLFGYLGGLVTLIPYRQSRIAQAGAALYATCIAIQLYWIFPYLPVAPVQVEWAQSPSKLSRLRILSSNVLQENLDASGLLRLIDEEQPDLVVLCEVNARWIEDLEPLQERFRYQCLHPQENRYGIALYTNLELLAADVRTIVSNEIPSIDARLRLKSGHELRVFAVHPNPPRPGEDTTKRDGELILVGREVQDDQTVVVLGDMNDVGWSRTTDLFKEVSRLLDPRIGRGLYPTYNATSLIWRYPLDHLFHSDDFRVAEIKRLADIGSDHFPLLVELSHEPAAAATQESPDLDQGDREDAQDAVDAARAAHDADL